MTLTYLGTASVLIDTGSVRVLTDPVLDEPGGTYDMGPAWAPAGWFGSTRSHPTPIPAAALGAVDVALLSHDHHFDNLDYAGRAFVLGRSVDTIVTNTASARRLAPLKRDVRGLATGESTTAAGIRITATPARHGPRLTPQVGQVSGFLLEGSHIPTIWFSGDTVMTPRLRHWLTAERHIDVAIIACGAVRFPSAPILSKARFTFDPAEVVDAALALNPRMLIPVHRSGWTHFASEGPLRDAINAAGLEPRTRWLEPGESVSIST
ncbi:MBL fold metallo-hydrolase [Salinibacterium soli]|uniref:MBL fold metallo-hydrolase n=1 Tax=Antiquaquibacter soli TaxID=3064523 RepID=A0ABT9BPI3_9MICO|nr:MBL fold metallo-hydrolase [Protaetiibacter sp. WY-16]MDO7882338.1 MBL fold metallo-hydrolase [Protaetiibacter sp. WY-16]